MRPSGLMSARALPSSLNTPITPSKGACSGSINHPVTLGGARATHKHCGDPPAQALGSQTDNDMLG